LEDVSCGVQSRSAIQFAVISACVVWGRALREARFSAERDGNTSRSRSPKPSQKPALDPFSVSQPEQPLNVPAASSPATSALPSGNGEGVSSHPPVEAGRKIGDYSDTELKSVMFWLQVNHPSAGAEDLITLAMAELGFTRRGKIIVSRLAEAI